MKIIEGIKSVFSQTIALIINMLLPASLGLAVLSVTALAQASSLCIPIHAEIQSTIVTDGCDSLVGLCTRGEITSGGILNGTTEFTALSLAPSGGMFGVEPETTLSYSGLLKISSKLGLLTIRDVGVFDTARGVFSELDRIMDGTGRYLGSSGTLFIYGTATADGSGFSGAIRGEICLAQ